MYLLKLDKIDKLYNFGGVNLENATKQQDKSRPQTL